MWRTRQPWEIDGAARDAGAVWQALSALNLASAAAPGPEGHHRLRDLFLEVVRRLRPRVACDIGANDGSAALAMRQASPGTAVHAFEANPEIHALHAERLAGAGVAWHGLALGREDGETTIYVPRTLSRAYVEGRIVEARITEPLDTGKSSLRRRNEDATYAEFRVPVRRLDRFFAAELRRRETDFALWIDVEGAADQVIDGATKVLARACCLLVEVEGHAFWSGQPKADSIVLMLMRRGFVPIARDREYGDAQFNVLFVAARSLPALGADLFDARSALRACLVPPAAPAIARPAPPASLAGEMQARIPVLIPCFDTVTYVRRMVDQLRGRGFRDIVLVDNASDYAPMRDYLEAAESAGVRVIRLPENRGPHHLVMEPRSLELLPELFCLTDPDLELNPAMPQDFLVDLVGLSRRHGIGKVGLALRIDDREAMTERPLRVGGKEWKIWEWEAQFWEHPVEVLPGGDQVFRAAVDTTFALYNRAFFKPETFFESLRVAGRFTARHLPWYRDHGLPDEELQHYRSRSRFSYMAAEGREEPHSPLLSGVSLTAFGAKAQAAQEASRPATPSPSAPPEAPPDTATGAGT